MTGEIHDYPTRVLVTSEDEGDRAAYLVDLCAYRISNENFFNGSCQCRDFIFRKEPNLKKTPGTIHRCKHILHARKIALDFLLFELCKRDPNLPESSQV